VTARGGTTCHAAVVARELGLPAVVGVADLGCALVTAGTQLTVDGTTGVVYEGLLPTTVAVLPKEVNLLLKWIKQSEAYQPCIGYDWLETKLSANELLNNFYLLQAMEAAAEGSPLTAEIRRLRRDVHHKTAESFALYLLIACSGESRYFDGFSSLNQYRGRAPEAYSEYIERSTAMARKLQGYVPGLGDHSMRGNQQLAAVNAMRGASIQRSAAFVALLVRAFCDFSWSPAYGGEKWGVIAKALFDFLTGTLSPTLFVDHVFDLRHNGGRLFDKHPMFVERTQESLLQKQLDCKKSATSIQDLYLGLKRLMASGWNLTALSPDIERLWGLGKSANLW
jgi:hypothetical protein